MMSGLIKRELSLIASPLGFNRLRACCVVSTFVYSAGISDKYPSAL